MRGWHIRVYTRSKHIRDFPSLYVLRPINCAAIKQHPANLVNLLPGVTSAVYPMGVSLATPVRPMKVETDDAPRGREAPPEAAFQTLSIVDRFLMCEVACGSSNVYTRAIHMRQNSSSLRTSQHTRSA